MTHFKIKTYTKRELALLYFPGGGCIPGKVTLLNRWLRRDPEFFRLLKENGYKPRCHTLSARQVQLIAAFLCEP